ncbi:MAG: valyl-tRNA synthetase [Candidatus Tokpelaia sp. JSC161]|nr:MAG: valyl-tRNA synthetase [Candidatus Tokpelaia sp. JSC161]
MLEKTYDPNDTERRIAVAWEKAGVFRAGAGADARAETFSIVIPPPNVTGSLHMGHALNNTIQDILIRFERMRGKNVLWQPGMDHAGIATQMVVERKLYEKKQSRKEMGRKKFIQCVWNWCHDSGAIIANQLRRLGISCDWSRERFTMDERFSDAVLEVFVSLYKKGLIYKDKQLVNWDPKLLTAISDLEVEQKEIKGNLWYFRYPLEGVLFNPLDSSTFVVVATTRPETMLGDVAIAVNPNDRLHAKLVGRRVILPFVGRKLSIISDDSVDPESGSGLVKITPAHDFNDFDIGRRHRLALISVLDRKADIVLKKNFEFMKGLERSFLLNELILKLDGQNRFVGRKKILEMMKEAGYLHEIKPYSHMVPHGDRSGVPIEPILTDQWYINAAELAKPAISSVHECSTNLIPKGWKKTYFYWMDNIKPWCISRQLWWGHQIPAWYGPDGKVFVEKTEKEAEAVALHYYGQKMRLVRDQDVLDTWFSSALWPFASLGWPQKTEDLNMYYPTNILVTGFDLIFFWVARMMMMSLHFMDQVPFRTVFMHALVRDKSGAKMSKSKGNVVDPLQLMDEYGADALRFSLVMMAGQGCDLKVDSARIAGYRNFCTKLWNAARFCKMNAPMQDFDFVPEETQLNVNRWVLTELTRVSSHVTESIASYRFHEAATALYSFVWNTFCDWYLELIKPLLQNSSHSDLIEIKGCVSWCLDNVYKLLHPFMPFITEDLWAMSKTARSDLLAVTRWPLLHFRDEGAADDMNWLVELVSAIRSLRGDLSLPSKLQVVLVIVGADDFDCKRLSSYQSMIKRLARIEKITFFNESPTLAAQMVFRNMILCIPIGSLLDVEVEQVRLRREIEKILKKIAKITEKLSNNQFIEKAKSEIVMAERKRLEEYQILKERTERALAFFDSNN